MLSFRDKNICLWLVPSRTGKVRKLRLSYKTAGLAVFGLVFLIGISLYMLFDYSRLKINKAVVYHLLHSATKNRDILQAQNKTLQDEIQFLSRVNERTLAYERNIKQRLEVLSSVVDSATSLGFFVQNKLGPQYSDVFDVGGAEIDCDLHGEKCREEASSFNLGGSGFSSLIRKDFLDKSGQELLDSLDMYSDILSVIPIGNPGNGHVSSHYGIRRSPFTRKMTRHQGIDYRLPYGSHALATADGIVKAVKRTSTYGRMVDIQHTDRVVTRFAHLSKIYVSTGEKVCRGEVIGLVGSTGRSTGPHLHYEIRVDGKPQNPS